MLGREIEHTLTEDSNLDDIIPQCNPRSKTRPMFSECGATDQDFHIVRTNTSLLSGKHLQEIMGTLRLLPSPIIPAQGVKDNHFYD